LYNACMERLHALKSQFDSSYEPLLQLMMEHNVTRAPVAVGAVALCRNVASPSRLLICPVVSIKGVS
jgi:hypothetical protein